jgi:RNA polymerase sigma-70 factor (ECF subfamily)
VGDVATAVERAFQTDWEGLVAHLTRVTGDWDLAEDCAQDAFVRALERWERDGVPRNPGGWLCTTAHNRALDRRRRDAVGAAKLQQVATAGVPQATDQPDGGNPTMIEDDRLRLIFTCCHPALPGDAQVALLLRTVAGLSTIEVARAFLVPTETMAKRLVRAKAKIRDAAIPYRVPPPSRLRDQRVVGVLAVVDTIFNEGYKAGHEADLVRRSLGEAAIRLGRLLRELMPQDPEVLGLLALMLLDDSRRTARVDAAGDRIPFEEQDRGQWDAAAIAEGCRMLAAAKRLGRPGPYQVRAAIAAGFCTPPAEEATDWLHISSLYGKLAGMVPSAVVLLNRAVALARLEGPTAGLRLVERLEASDEIRGTHQLAATRANLLRRCGRPEAAAGAYREAVRKAPSEGQRRFLTRRLIEVGGQPLTDARSFPSGAGPFVSWPGPACLPR